MLESSKASLNGWAIDTAAPVDLNDTSSNDNVSVAPLRTCLSRDNRLLPDLNVIGRLRSRSSSFI